jgi:SAM-dependent methyltransferase
MTDLPELDTGFRPLRGAAWYKRAQAWALSRQSARYEALVRGEKRALLGSLTGSVVEIGPGAGGNLEYLPPGVRWIGVEPNPYFEGHLRRRAERLGWTIDIRAGAAERLPVGDGEADAVVSTLVLCSVRDPAAALREIRRVLRPGGRFVFMEHVAGRPRSGTRLAQAILTPIWTALGDGCHLDRDTGDTIAAAGFARVEIRRLALPIPVLGPHVAGTAWAA